MTDVIGIGTAFVDYYFQDGEEFLAKHHVTIEDSIYVSEKLPFSTILEELPLFAKGAGGIASNTLIVLDRLGIPTSYFGVIGSDREGDYWVNNIGTVDTSHIVRAGEMSKCASILTHGGKQRTFISELNTQDNAILDNIDYTYLNTARILHIAQLELDHDKSFFAIEKIMEKVSAGISFSPGVVYIQLGLQVLIPFLKKTQILFLNEQEMELLTQLPYKEGAKQLLDIGVGMVACTRGENGSYIATKNESVESSPEKNTNVVDSTCAGDTFAAGLLYGILKNKPLEESAVIANRLASLVLSDYGLRSITKESAMDVLAKV